MGKHFHCTDEIIIVSKGKEDIGKIPALGNDGKLDPSVIPEIAGDTITHPACLAYFSKDSLSLPSGKTVISMDGVKYDTGNFHTGENGKFQINETGIYLIVYQIYLSVYSDTTNVYLVKNEKDFIACLHPAYDANVVAFVRLEKGDYIQPVVSHSAGSAIPLVIHNSTKTENYIPYVSIMKMSD